MRRYRRTNKGKCISTSYLQAILFVHDFDHHDLDISTGDFPVEQLANAIINSSMIEYACRIYLSERKQIKEKVISAWFCPDIVVAEKTLKPLKV